MAPGSKWTPPPASMKIVNAFSRHFTVISRRGGMSMTVTYENGELKNTQKGMVADADGTEVSFVPSIRTFPGFHYRLKHLRHWMQHYARLHPGLILVLTSVEVFFATRHPEGGARESKSLRLLTSAIQAERERKIARPESAGKDWQKQVLH